MTFDRPYDRSSIATNAYGIAHTIAPVIGCNRLFDRLCSIPLIPPTDRSALARAFHPGLDPAALSLRWDQNPLDRAMPFHSAVRCPSVLIRDTFPCMTNTAVARSRQKPPRERPIGRKLQQAIDLLLDGTCKSQKAVCDRLKLSPSYLSRSLKSERIRAFVTRRTAETIAAAQLPATATVLRLLEGAKSEHVQFDAAKHMLALNGHRVSDGPSVNVNIGSGAPGYVIMLANRDSEIYEGDVTEGVGGVVYGRKMSDRERSEGVVEQHHPMIDVTPNRGPADE